MRIRKNTIRLLAACAVACATLIAAASAEALQGQLIDRRTARPLVGAEVAVVGLAGTVRTGPDGRFAWATDPTPPFDVLIMLPGGAMARPVRILSRTDGSPLIIHVDPAIVERLVVSGAAPSVDAAPFAAADLLSSADIARRAPANLVRALENVPGVGSVAEGQNAVPAIRGLARGRTLVLIDGSRLFSERRAGPSVSFLAPESLDRIDVVRGPASVAYGSDAFGGVISVVTRQPSVSAPIAAKLTGAFGAGIPAKRADIEISTGLGPRAALLAFGRYRQTRDYSSPDGVVPNSAWKDQGGLLRALAQAGGWWTAGWQGDAVGVSGYPRSDAATLRLSSPYERSQRGSISFDRAGLRGAGQVSASAMFGRYSQRIDQDRLPAPGRPRRIDRADIGGTDVQVRIVSRTGIGRSRLTSGVDFTGRHGLTAHDIGIIFNTAGDVTSTTDTASIASARKSDLGVFTQVDLPLASRITVTAGGRYDRARSVNAGGFFGDRVVSHGAGSGSMAIAVRPWTPLTVTAQLSRGFRDPTLSDRFYRGPVGRGFIVGNPDLGPERSVQFDAGARYDNSRWRAGVSAYRYGIEDLVERYPSGAETFLFRNRGRAELRGVELETQVDIGWGVVLNLAGQASRGRAADDDAALDDQAPRSLILQARKKIGARLFVAGRVAVIAANTRPGPSEVATPSYVDAGASGSCRFGRLELRLAAANLLNERYYSSPGPRWVLAPGRNATITAVVKF